jgi:hypothetical protein
MRVHKFMSVREERFDEGKLEEQAALIGELQAVSMSAAERRYNDN